MDDLTKVYSETEFRVGRALSLGVKLALRRIGLYALLGILGACIFPILSWVWEFVTGSQFQMYLGSEDNEILNSINILKVCVSWITQALVAATVCYFAAFDLGLYKRAVNSDHIKGLVTPRTPAQRILMGSGTHIAVAIISMIGVLFFIVPGLILAAMLVSAVVICVVEGGGIVQALKRSRDLTYGHRMNIFVTVMILTIAVMVIVSVAVALGTKFVPIPESKLFSWLFEDALGSVLQVFFAATTVAIYHLLLNNKERSSHDIENVFS